jgi:hypothetical protein
VVCRRQLDPVLLGISFRSSGKRVSDRQPRWHHIYSTLDPMSSGPTT